MRIDLNADLGEERGDDAAIFPSLSSANIACGAHAGGARAMDVALAAASTLGVTVGAHVGYEDRANFGRVPLAIPPADLSASIQEQIQQLVDRAARFNLRVRYVKPHGALYHQVGVDEAAAAALVEAVRNCDPELELLVPFSPILTLASTGLQCRHEFFADRGYLLNGQLVPRTDPRAHIDDVAALVDRTLTWLATGEVLSVEGKPIRILADSICIHGDSVFAVESASALHTALASNGFRIANWMEP